MPAHKINPESRKKIISIRLPKYIIDALDVESQAHKTNRAVTVENAVVDKLGLTRPIRQVKSEN